MKALAKGSWLPSQARHVRHEVGLQRCSKCRPPAARVVVNTINDCSTTTATAPTAASAGTNGEGVADALLGPESQHAGTSSTSSSAINGNGNGRGRALEHRASRAARRAQITEARAQAGTRPRFTMETTLLAAGLAGAGVLALLYRQLSAGLASRAQATVSGTSKALTQVRGLHISPPSSLCMPASLHTSLCTPVWLPNCKPCPAAAAARDVWGEVPGAPVAQGAEEHGATAHGLSCASEQACKPREAVPVCAGRQAASFVQAFARSLSPAAGCLACGAGPAAQAAAEGGADAAERVL